MARSAAALAMAATLALAGTALASNPSASTGSATEVTGGSATLNGTVNPQGEATKYKFEYDYANSTFCQNGGTGGSPFSTALTDLGSTDSTDHAVQATISVGPGQSRCFRVVASRSDNSGSAAGSTVNFNTPAMTVRTDAASSLVNGGATLNGTINPQGYSPPSDPYNINGYTFRYGPSSSNYCTSGGTNIGLGSDAGNTPFTSLGYSDSSDHPVSARINGLAPSTAYCFRLYYGGQAGSPLRSFTTGPPVTLTMHTTGLGLVEAPFRGGLVYDPGKGDDHQGIACGGRSPALVEGEYMDCSAAYVQGTVVTLNAKAYLNSGPVRFLGWSGACSGTGPTCAVTMSGNTTVGAEFTKGSSVAPGIDGRVNAGSATVGKGGVATLKTVVDCTTSSVKCSYKDSGTTAGAVKSSAKVKIGSYKGKVKAGKKGRVKFKLNKKGLKLLKRRKKLKAAIKITVSSGGKAAKKTVKVTLKKKKR